MSLLKSPSVKTGSYVNSKRIRPYNLTMKLKINLKRVYEAPAPADGYRILVDRLWPRGLARETAMIDRWEKEAAPSAALRKWFAHDPALWQGFRSKYLAELRANELLPQLAALIREKQTVTLLYAAKDTEHNQAVVLKAYLEKLCDPGN